MTQIAPHQDPPQFDEPQRDANKTKGFGWKGIVLGVLIGAIATGISVRVMSPKIDKTNSAIAAKSVPKTPSRSVTIVTASTQAIAKTIEAVGTVAAVDLISVNSPRTGLRITDVLVKEGDSVESGQVLAQLDNASLNAELLQAEAQVAQAEAHLAELKAGARVEELQRAKEQINQAKAALKRSQVDLKLAEQRLTRNQALFAQGAIAADTLDENKNRRDAATASLNQSQANLRSAQESLTELQRGTRVETIAQAEAQLQQAQAQVTLVKTRLDETQITAPRAGKIIKKLAQVGDLTSASDPLFTLVESGQLELQVKIPETQLNQVQVGQSVTITADSDRTLQMTGAISEIVPTIDQQSRQATLKITLSATDNLKPGMLLRAKIITAQAEGFTLPTEAIIPKDGEKATIFRLNPDNTVVAVEAQLGELLSTDQVEILSGIKDGDRLVVKGAAYLKDGDLVAIAKEQF